MSAVKVLTPLGIREEDLNLLRNDHIKFSCGPLAYLTIIHWGFTKPDGMKIIDHFNYLKIGEKIKKKKFRQWLKDNKSKLDKHSFSDFDITALHDFLPILCYDKIAQTFSLEYEEQIKDPHTLERLLKDIKDFRNNVSHEYSEAVKGSHVENMKETMRECIRVAGKLYGKDQTEINEKVKVLDDEFEKVLINTTHFYDNRVKYIAQKISSEVPAIMLERYSPHFSVLLPDSSRKIDFSEIFHCSNLSITAEDNINININKITIFTCTEIYNNKRDIFIVINGGPGSGKTTLMRNICQDILQTAVHRSESKYEKNDQFKIPIFLECRFEQQSSLATFLKECLQNFVSTEDDIYEALKIVKGLIFLIDGYDEINNNCRILVDSIIQFCRDYNTTCIVSSRVDAGNNFVNQLEKWNLYCTKMFIEPISELNEKLSFLRSYTDKMDDNIDSDKLVNSFANLTDSAQGIFSSPILLGLFISMFLTHLNSLSQLKSEQSAYEAVQTSFLCEMERKWKNYPDSKERAEEVFYVVNNFCLKLFREKKYFLEEEDYSKMVDECERIKGMPDDVNIPSLLSCILTPGYSFKFTHYTSYQFMHSTIKEYLAAKYLSKNLKELPDDISSQNYSEDKSKLLQTIGLDESQSDIKKEMERYGNIIKLLILETLANGKLSEYRNNFTQLLENILEPQYTPTYYLDLILSSGSNADIISFVSDCLSAMKSYNLKFNRHIKTMTEVMQKLQTGVDVVINSHDVINTQHIIELLKVLGDDNDIMFYFLHSYDKYQPLEDSYCYSYYIILLFIK